MVQFLEFGWPVDRDPDHPLELGGINHKGATQFPETIDKYIEKELKHGAMLGPLDHIPFRSPVAISPLSTRPKRDSAEHRVIMDCIWPIGRSLNDGIDKNCYLNNVIHLSYPTVDDLARRIYELKVADPMATI